MFIHILLIIAMIGAAILLLPKLIVEVFSLGKIFPMETAPSSTVAVVFGAGLNRDGSATPVLRHRVATAADLYFQQKVQKILMSGDNRFENYNEPAAMYDYAVQLGVPPEDIVLDYAGRRTYDTCYRARDIFQVDQVLLITQRFHLPRAIFICNLLGLDANGVSANRTDYRIRSRLIWNIRELPATLVALWEVLVTHPEPVLGNPEPIILENHNDTDRNMARDLRSDHE